MGRSTIREVFLHLCTDPATIAYRQDILDDLWRNPDFAAHLEALLPDLNALDTSHIAVDRRRSSLQEITWRLGELEHLVNCVSGLSAVFAQVGDAGACRRLAYPARPYCADGAGPRVPAADPRTAGHVADRASQGQCDHRGKSG